MSILLEFLGSYLFYNLLRDTIIFLASLQLLLWDPLWAPSYPICEGIGGMHFFKFYPFIIVSTYLGWVNFLSPLFDIFSILLKK